MKALLPLLLLQFSIFNGIHAQPIETAFEDVKNLCLPEMAGRGYQNAGHKIAAQYIFNRFQKLGLTPGIEKTNYYSEGYQYFSFTVNLCQKAKIILDNKPLKPGIDFILYPASGSFQGCLDFENLDYGMGEDWEGSKVKGKAVYTQLGYPEDYSTKSIPQKIFEPQTKPAFKLKMASEYKAGALFMGREKLTASFSGYSYPFPIIEVISNKYKWQKIRKAELDIQMQIDTVNSQNIVFSIPGNIDSDSIIIICAHYDHLGKQDSAIFFGANDNASGIAFMLGLAYRYSTQIKPDQTLVFIAFGGEEAGLKGSNYFANKIPTDIKSRIRYVLNFDLMGNGVDGITVVGGVENPELFNKLEKSNAEHLYIKQISKRGNAPNSDHYPFTQIGVPAIFIYTQGGPPFYHDVYDVPDQVRFPEWEDLNSLISELIPGKKIK
jgi:hypothetical protein